MNYDSKLMKLVKAGVVLAVAVFLGRGQSVSDHFSPFRTKTLPSRPTMICSAPAMRTATGRSAQT